jgi:predicted  nucleic acid-binding Zn-ribbon protein
MGFTASDFLSILGPLAAFLAPLLVFAAANARLRHDRSRAHATDDAGLWDRMAKMVDRYGARADSLEDALRQLRSRVTTAEDRADVLARKVARLEIAITQWRAYAVALISQVRGAGLTPVNPRDYGITDDPGEQD